MELPALIRKKAEKLLAGYCAGKTFSLACGSAGLRYEIKGDCLTLFAESGPCQACGPGEVRPVARFCYNHDLCQWTLHQPEPGRGWRFYLNAGPSLNLDKLLRHVDEDPLGVFWP